MLIRAIFIRKFSQGSVVTHLRCKEIFSDPSVKHSLQRRLVKEF